MTDAPKPSTEAKPPAAPAPSTAVVPRRVMADVFDLGKAIATVEAGERPPTKSEIAGACVRAHFVRTRGLPDDAAFRVWFLRGGLVLGADVYRALARDAGYRIERVDSSDTSCTARIYDRDGEVLGETTYTIEDAQLAGLVKPRGNYETQPKRMLWARASSLVVRDYTSVVFGMSEDELGGGGEPAADYIEGEAVDLAPDVDWPDDEPELDAAAAYDAAEELSEDADAGAVPEGEVVPEAAR